LRRKIDPGKNQRYGVFSPTGESLESSIHGIEHETFDEVRRNSRYVVWNNKKMIKDYIALDEELDQKIDDKNRKGREYYCEACQQTFWFENNVYILKHKKTHH